MHVKHKLFQLQKRSMLFKVAQLFLFVLSIAMTIKVTYESSLRKLNVFYVYSLSSILL